MNISRTELWRWLRERKILAQHRRVAAICERLIADYRKQKVTYTFKPKVTFDTDRLIWQYWAQGYDNVPPVVLDCFDSVDKYATDYKVIRLSDATLSSYIDVPEFLMKKRGLMTTAHFSDILRSMLLKTYGGIWMDATIMLTGPIPEEYAERDFFVYRRDPSEPNYRYWRNVYAYYFGWAKGFRVNMLSSFIVSKKRNPAISELCDLLLLWWTNNNTLPDYFFFQILFDTNDKAFVSEIVSDTLPHYLQQSINDPKFNIMSPMDIIRKIPIHKLTYK